MTRKSFTMFSCDSEGAGLAKSYNPTLPSTATTSAASQPMTTVKSWHHLTRPRRLRYSQQARWLDLEMRVFEIVLPMTW